MTLLIFYLLLALCISFLCSIMEAVLLSTPLSYMKTREKKGSKSMQRISALKKHIDKPLAAILSLNTVAHTIGAAGVGAQATEVFGDEYFGVASAVLTMLILIFTEIIPKTIGARYWRQLIIAAGNLIRVTIIITYPLVILSAVITRLFSKESNMQTTSREEISALADIGAQEGIFVEKENKILQNLFRLKKINVTEIMTPRVVLSAAHENMGLQEFLEHKNYLRFSRIPVFSGSIEHITGYIIRQEIFEKLAEEQTQLKLKDIRREIVIIPAVKEIFSAWEILLEKKEHIALIIDEYGGTQGIITMEDVIETLLGIEIVDEKDTITDMQQYAREKWQKRQEKYKYLK